MRLALPLALLLAATSPHSEERPLPSSWWALANSVNSSDLTLVKELRALDWRVACVDWGRGSRTTVETRRQRALSLMLAHDGVLNDLDRQFAPARRVEIGMNTCGVLAAFGSPTTTNTTRTASATSAQLVYRERRLYVYTEGPPNSGNGLVTAIQQ